MEGFSGRDNYGVARMNGGFGSRVAVGFMNGFGLAGRFRDDVHRVLNSRSFPSWGAKTTSRDWHAIYLFRVYEVLTVQGFALPTSTSMASKSKSIAGSVVVATSSDFKSKTYS